MVDENDSRYTLQGRELVSYVVQQASEDVKNALIERDERRNRRTAFMLSILALVGVGSLVSALKIFVRSEIDVLNTRFKDQATELQKMVDDRATTIQNDFKVRVDASVAKSVDTRVAELMKTLEENDLFEQYSELAMALPEKVAGINQRGDKYLAEALRETLTAAEQMAGIKRLTRRGRFLRATRKIVDVMTRFNRESEINRLDDILGDVMATDPEISRTLVDHYGQLVVGSPQPVDSMTAEMTRLNRYLRAAKELGYPEKALVWMVFTEFKRSGYQRNDTTDRLLESTKDLEYGDAAEFWFNLYVYTNPLNWMKAADQQGRELARLMENLIAKYKVNGDDLAALMDQNLARNPELQQRLADLRAKNPAWRQLAEQTATAKTEPADAPAEAPRAAAAEKGDGNELR